MTLTFLSFAMLFTLTQCNESMSENHLEKADSRGKTISALMNNDAYMKEVMDSMQTKHGDAMVNSVFGMAKDDKQMQNTMMDKMAGMCKTDTSTFKTMMGKAMDMCDSDPSKRSIMMGTMQSRPNVMKSVEDMKGMKMDKK